MIDVHVTLSYLIIFGVSSKLLYFFFLKINVTMMSGGGDRGRDAMFT